MNQTGKNKQKDNSIINSVRTESLDISKIFRKVFRFIAKEMKLTKNRAYLERNVKTAGYKKDFVTIGFHHNVTQLSPTEI